MKLPDLYRQMVRARAYELAVAGLWERGLISGEMHLGTGEEALAAGVVTHLREGDGLSLTHRCSPALVVRGVPLVPMLRELLGRSDGLCHGRGGHMHLFWRPQLCATSGIVGASVPLAAGFSLAARRLRPGSIGLAFTGEGAMNQGMLLETLNLAAAWSLPLLVVCVDNGWAITTRSEAVTGGDLGERVRSFGWAVERIDGTDVERVHEISGALVARCRSAKGPAFLLAACPRLDGHFLGDPLLQQSHHPLGDDAVRTVGRVVSSALQPGGGGPVARTASVARMIGALGKARLTPTREGRNDPVRVAERAMESKLEERRQIDAEVEREIAAAVEAALAEQEAAHA